MTTNIILTAVFKGAPAAAAGVSSQKYECETRLQAERIKKQLEADLAGSGIRVTCSIVDINIK